MISTKKITIDKRSSFKKFEKELMNLLNKHSVDDYCDIPDYILAKDLLKYIIKCKDRGKRHIIRSTWLGNLNFFILQWFFIRLGKSGIRINGEFIQTGWKIVKFPIPLTGWWNDYIWLYKKDSSTD